MDPTNVIEIHSRQIENLTLVAVEQSAKVNGKDCSTNPHQFHIGTLNPERVTSLIGSTILSQVVSLKVKGNQEANLQNKLAGFSIEEPDSNRRESRLSEPFSPRHRAAKRNH
jgi:hypothetical protein